jgi:large subunit ribosomal protein L2
MVNPYYDYYLKLLKQGIKHLAQIKKLAYGVSAKGGRSRGRIVSPRRGALHNYCYRFIDFGRKIFPNKPSIVIRTQYIAPKEKKATLVCYPNGVFLYILTPSKMEGVLTVRNLCVHPSNIGDSAELANIPAGAIIHNLALNPRSIGQLTRASGSSTILVRKDGDHCLVKLKSGELRYIPSSATATLGTVGREDHFLRNYGKAGVIRRLGRRPRTRPSAMNPVDHPMGGRTRGGGQPTNLKGIITTHRSTKSYRHPMILYTSRQMKFQRF